MTLRPRPPTQPDQSHRRTLPLRTTLAIRFGFILLVTILAILFVDIFGIPFTRFNGRYQKYRTDAFNNLDGLADQRAKQIRSWVSERDHELHFFTDDSTFRQEVVRLVRITEASGHAPSSLASMRGYLDRFNLILRQHAEYDHIELVDSASRTILWTTNPSQLGTPFIADHLLDMKHTSTRMCVGELEIDSSTGEPRIHLGRPVVNASKRTVALLVIAIYPNRALIPLLTDQSDGRDGIETVLVDHERRTILPLGHPVAVTADSLKYGVVIHAEPATLAAHGRSGIIEAKDYRGVPVLAAYRHIPFANQRGWGLVVKQDRDKVFGDIRTEIQAMGIVALVFIVLGLLWIIYSVHRVTRPIEQMAAIARKVAAGDFHARTRVRGSDELGTLGATFDHMVEQVGQWQQELEEEVERRTTLLRDSQRRLRQTLEAAHGGFYTIEYPLGESIYHEETTIAFSDELRRMVGYSPAELPDQLSSWRALLHEQDMSSQVERLQAYLEGKAEAYDEIFRLQQSDGNILWVRSIAHLESDTSQGVSRLSGIMIDVSPLKESEIENRRLKESFEALIHEAPLAITLLDLEGRVLLFNPEAERIFGWKSDEVIGTFNPIIPKTEHDAYLRHLHSVAHGKQIHGSESRRLRKDGTLIDISLYKAPIHGPDGSIDSIMGIMEDITERKQIERELHRLNSELEERVRLRTQQLEVANRELESFAYSVSHDLRAPLRSLDGFSQALLEDYREDLDETAQDYLDRIRNASQKMGELIDSLLVLSRVSRADLRPEKVNLTEIAAGIVRELEQEEPERSVQVDIEPEMYAKADRQLAVTLMRNLIENAWKFTRHKAGGNIEVGVEQKNGRPVFHVSDNGAGFDPAYINKLFEPFQRLHSQQEFEGTGIGLATVKRILQRHGGWIQAEGTRGEGARFTFSFTPNTREVPS